MVASFGQVVIEVRDFEKEVTTCTLGTWRGKHVRTCMLFRQERRQIDFCLSCYHVRESVTRSMLLPHLLPADAKQISDHKLRAHQLLHRALSLSDSLIKLELSPFVVTSRRERSLSISTVSRNV